MLPSAQPVCQQDELLHRQRLLTIGADIDESSHMRTDAAPIFLLQNVGLVPAQFVDNIGVGHGVTFEEVEYVAVVFGRLFHALSVHDYVGVVEVGGVYVWMLLLVGDKPLGDELVSFVAPEVLLALEDLWLGLSARHDAGVVFVLSRGDGDLCSETRERCCGLKVRGES